MLLINAFLKLPVKRSASEPIGNIQTCINDFECGSGYCQRFSNDTIKKLKKNAAELSLTSKMGKIKEGRGICLPMAKCAEMCVRTDESISRPDQYCCPGLFAVNGKCVSISEAISLSANV